MDEKGVQPYKSPRKQAKKVKASKFRGFNKSNLTNWFILLEKQGFVKCSFVNCCFMAFDVEGMAEHYSRCNSDNSSIKFRCGHCDAGIDTELNLLKHKVLHHPDQAEVQDVRDFLEKEDTMFPSSCPNREVSYVMKKSWQMFLDLKGYIKCLVQTCLYVTNTIEQMTSHYTNYCTPQYRENLMFICATCKGRTELLSDLEKHCRTARHSLEKPKPIPVLPPVLSYWSMLLQELNWAKCFNRNCNFIECDINELKAHYGKCVTPTKKGYVECFKCHGWLSGIPRLGQHIKMAHNPYNPCPIVYMIPVSLDADNVVSFNEADVSRILSSDANSASCKDLFYNLVESTNIDQLSNGGESPQTQTEKKKLNNSQSNSLWSDDLITYLNEQSNRSIGSKHSPILFNCDDDTTFERRTVIRRRLSDSLPLDFDSSQEKASCDRKRRSSSLPRSDAKQQESMSVFYKRDSNKVNTDSNQNEEHSSSEDDQFETPSKLDSMKTYCHLTPGTKKLPHIYPAYVPRHTFKIDCTKAQRGQVTFPKDLINTNEWKLELPHVTLHSRNSTKRKPPAVASATKTVKSTLSKLAQEMVKKEGPLVPVAIKVTDIDAEWTMHVPKVDMRVTNSEIKNESSLNDRKSENFKEEFWDSIESDLMELLKISVNNSSIRNTIRYHKHNTRSKQNHTEPEEDILFNFERIKKEKIADDPRKDLGLSSDVDSDCDVFINDPIDASSLSDTSDDCSSKKISLPKPHKLQKPPVNQIIDNRTKTPLNVDSSSTKVSEPNASKKNNVDNINTEENLKILEKVNTNKRSLRNRRVHSNSTKQTELNNSKPDMIVSNGINNNELSSITSIKEMKDNNLNDILKPRGIYNNTVQVYTVEVSYSTVRETDNTPNTKVTKKPSSVCSDGIHCGTDDESLDSPPPPPNHPRPSNNEQQSIESLNTMCSDLNSSAEETHRTVVKEESCEFPQPVQIKQEFIDEENSDPETRMLNSVPKNSRKRRKTSSTHSGNSVTPKVKLARPSDDNVICPEVMDYLTLETNEAFAPVPVSRLPPARKSSGRGRKRGSGSRTPSLPVSPSPLFPISGAECSTPVARTYKKRGGNSSRPRGHPPSENSLNSDLDISTATEDSPVPGTPEGPQIPMKTRKPKSKRSSDIMMSLGERITPTSILSIPEIEVQCAVCLQVMTAKEYQDVHLAEHNFLCWLTVEAPLPLDDFNTMVLVANRGKRAHRDHVFKCEKCKRSCKSASGHLCHIRFCGKTKQEADSLMIPCTMCNRLFKPNCIDQHIRVAHCKGATPDEIEASNSKPTRSTAIMSKKKISEFVGILSANEDGDRNVRPVTPAKPEPTNRVITKKLLRSWKEADSKGEVLFCPITNCDFSCNCYDTIQSHYRACNPLDPNQQVFKCKLCSYRTNFKESYSTHMKEEHCLHVHFPENLAYYPVKFLKNLEDDIYCSFTWVRCTTIFKPCFQLTKELRDKYLSRESLFPDLLVGWDDWAYLEDDNPAFQPYYHTSPAIRYNSTSEWLRLPCYSAATFKAPPMLEQDALHSNRLESKEGESLLWTGGCVQSMAWCPTPAGVLTDQYLAMSCLLNFNKVFTIGNTYKEPTTVQLWNYGSILNSEWLEGTGDQTKTPVLSYALCIDEGPIWDLEWCPSGCYDLRRIGILACATASGAVNIYTLPHPNQLSIPADRCPLFKGVPSLRLMFSRNESYQCQKISWSQVKPHKLIAGGFVNGFVAVWDLSVCSTFLREGSVLYPCRLFQAHHSTITCIRMCPVDSNFLVTGSLDKYIKLWDLREVGHPVHSMVRGGITDLDWLTNWLGFSFGMDAGLTPSPSSVFFSSVRDFSFIPAPLIGHSTASVKSISGNDWINCLVTGYDDGNVILTSCLRQFGDGSEAKKKVSKFILRTELVDLSKEKNGETQGEVVVPDDSSSYEDTMNMFGISISTSTQFEEKGKLDTVEEPRNDVYPIHTVTKVCFNPNQSSFLTLAVGFESGFVSTVQLLPSRQVHPDINALSSDVIPLSEDFKY